MDPFQALATFVLGRLQQSAIALWLRFLFEILFSGCVSFLLIAGTTLVTSKSWAIAIGTGMATAAVVMTAVFRKESSRLTKGMFVVLPQLEAQQEIATNTITIEKPK